MIKQNETGKERYTLEAEDVADFWYAIESYFYDSALENITDNDADFDDDYAQHYYDAVMTDSEYVVQEDTGGTYYFDYNLLSKEQESKLISNVQKELSRVLKN